MSGDFSNECVCIDKEDKKNLIKFLEEGILDEDKATLDYLKISGVISNAFYYGDEGIVNIPFGMSPKEVFINLSKDESKHAGNLRVILQLIKGIRECK